MAGTGSNRYHGFSQACRAKSSWWIVGVSGLVAADSRVDGGFLDFISALVVRGHQVTKDAYERWVTSSPIERLRLEPDDRPEITDGKWGRVNARALPC